MRPLISLAALLFAACVVALVCFVALPLAGIAWQSFRADDGSYTFANYLQFLKSPRLQEATFNTLIVSTLAAIGAVLIATPLAFGVGRRIARHRDQ